MYKLLVVDDEQIVTDSIEYMVKKFMHTPIQTEVAHSGREAIEKAATGHPDFVIIDIKMPGINGLEAIREIKRENPGTLFIVISAFAKFDYAKEAIQLGVIEYLNKPLTRKSLIDALENAVNRKEQEQIKLKTELDYREKIAYARPALENSLIHCITFPGNHDAEIASLEKILDISGGGYIMTIEIRPGEGAAEISPDLGERKVYPLLREILKEANAACVVGPLLVNSVSVFVPCAEGSTSGQRDNIMSFSAEVYRQLCKNIAGRNFRIGVGNKYTSLQCLYKSYEESIKAILSESNQPVIFFRDISDNSKQKKHFPQEEEKSILKKISCGETNAALASFENLFGWMINRYGADLSALKSAMLPLVVLIFNVSGSKSFESEENYGSNYVNSFLALQNQEAVRVWVKNLIQQVSAAMTEIREKGLSPVIKIAVDYIAQNYNKNITLEDVAGAVNVSPTYFSKVFKEEVGSTFIDYLTMLRIKKAKQLIAEGRLSNKEICNIIGYSDPNYFSRVFKKTVGATPTEYQFLLSVHKADEIMGG
jgi:two-component system, response regulator YesN